MNFLLGTNKYLTRTGDEVELLELIGSFYKGRLTISGSFVLYNKDGNAACPNKRELDLIIGCCGCRFTGE